MTKLMEIPDGLQTYFLTETIGDTLPEVRREGTRVIVPVFVRKTADGYRYFEVPVPFTGQPLDDYDACCLAGYSALRSAFYAEPAQSELRDDGRWEAHRLAVRAAFPRIVGETQTAAARFDGIRAAFWGSVDAALAEMGETRAILPQQFTAEWMLEHAAGKLSAERIAAYAENFSIVSLNLLHNRRTWEELFR